MANEIESLKMKCLSRYKVLTTPGSGKIFQEIDARRAELLPNFQGYTKRVEAFVEENKQTNMEKKRSIEVWKILRKIIESHVDGGYLALGGSTLSKLATRGADLDLCVGIRSTDGNYDEEGVNKNVLQRIYLALEDSEIILRQNFIDARVPILKLKMVFPYHEINVDINCNCVAGIYNSHLLFYFARIDERFVHMNVILKEWAKTNDVVNPRYGKLNSYTISLMIIHFLQCGVFPPILPNLYALYPQYFGGTCNLEDLNYTLDLQLPEIPKNNRTVGELIYGFLEYYSRFKYNYWGISIREGRIYDRKSQPSEDEKFLFFLEEAYDGMTVPKNLTEPHKLAEIVKTFQYYRTVILRDICGGEHMMPPINTSNDFTMEDRIWKWTNGVEAARNSN